MTNEEAKDRKGIYTSIKEAPEGRKLRMALFFSAFSILMIYLDWFSDGMVLEGRLHRDNNDRSCDLPCIKAFRQEEP